MEERKYLKSVDLLLSFADNLNKMFNDIQRNEESTENAINNLKDLQNIITSCYDSNNK